MKMYTRKPGLEYFELNRAEVWTIHADHEKNSPYTNDTYIIISGIEYHNLSMNGIL